MAGTKLGGIKAKETNKRLYGEDFYRKIGKKGGSVLTEKPKGFAASGLGQSAGKKGGQSSSRRHRKKIFGII